MTSQSAGGLLFLRGSRSVDHRVGYIDRILLSQDVCLKTYARSHGGYGYDHILRTIVTMMKRIGLTDKEINHMMIQNPARVLAC